MVVVESHGAQGVPLAAAGGGEHFQAQMPGQLHRGHADTSGGGVHQHPLPRFDVGQVDERHVGGGENRRDAGGFGVGPVGGLVLQQAHVAGHQRAAAVGEEAVHRVADREFGDARPDLDDHAGTFAAEQGVVGEHAQRDHHVAEVGGDGAQGHPNLARLQRGIRVGNRFELQVFEGARAADAEPPGPVFRRCHDAVDRAAAVYACRVDRAVAEQHLGFAGRQGRGQRGIVKCGIGID